MKIKVLFILAILILVVNAEDLENYTQGICKYSLDTLVIFNYGNGRNDLHCDTADKWSYLIYGPNSYYYDGKDVLYVYIWEGTQLLAYSTKKSEVLWNQAIKQMYFDFILYKNKIKIFDGNDIVSYNASDFSFLQKTILNAEKYGRSFWNGESYFNGPFLFLSKANTISKIGRIYSLKENVFSDSIRISTDFLPWGTSRCKNVEISKFNEIDNYIAGESDRYLIISCYMGKIKEYRDKKIFVKYYLFDKKRCVLKEIRGLPDLNLQNLPAIRTFSFYDHKSAVVAGNVYGSPNKCIFYNLTFE